MQYTSLKWLIFTTLSMTGPAIFFLVMVVLFFPAVFMVAGFFYVIPKMFVPGHTAESFSFLLMLGAHILVFGGLYYAISVLFAKVIMLFKNPPIRSFLAILLCSGFILMTRFPIYGGAGGHRPAQLFTLPELFEEINRTYGAGSVEIVYGAVLALVTGIIILQKLRKSRTGQT